MIGVPEKSHSFRMVGELFIGPWVFLKNSGHCSDLFSKFQKFGRKCNITLLKHQNIKKTSVSKVFYFLPSALGHFQKMLESFSYIKWCESHF